jgi:hypothetical protein
MERGNSVGRERYGNQVFVTNDLRSCTLQEMVQAVLSLPVSIDFKKVSQLHFIPPNVSPKTVK